MVLGAMFPICLRANLAAVFLLIAYVIFVQDYVFAIFRTVKTTA